MAYKWIYISTMKYYSIIISISKIRVLKKKNSKLLKNSSSEFLVLINSTVQKFTATSFQLYPYVKQHGSRSDLTIVKPDLGSNYLQKFTSTSCQLYPYVKQYGSRSDLTTVKPDLGLNYLQKFTATSFQLYPYVKQHGSRSDLTIVTPDLGPNYLQKFTST